MKGQEENDKKGQWLPSYIRAKRRGSSMKLCRLAFRGSGNEDLLPTEVISLLKNFSVVIIDCCDKEICLFAASYYNVDFVITQTQAFVRMHAVYNACTRARIHTCKCKKTKSDFD